jgi:hypothetical protein
MSRMPIHHMNISTYLGIVLWGVVDAARNILAIGLDSLKGGAPYA